MSKNPQAPNGAVAQSQAAAKQKLRRYESIWKTIEAAEPGKVVKVRCHPSHQQTLIQAVRKEKAKVNAPRKQVDAAYHGRLLVEQQGEEVLFSLAYNGNHV